MIRAVLLVVMFAVGFAAGGLFPSYSAHYRAMLHARLDQVGDDLAPFQDIADQYHGGSMARLVAHHLASDDPTFHAEGVAIQAMLDTRTDLATAFQAMQSTPVDQAVHLVQQADTDLAREARATFKPGIAVSPDALGIAAVTGLVMCLIYLAAWTGFRSLVFRR